MKIYFNDTFLHFLLKEDHAVVSPSITIDSKFVLEDLIECYQKEINKQAVFIQLEMPTEDFFSVLDAKFKRITAGGGMVYNEKGEVLVIKRLGVFDLPKGKLEDGEEISQCSVREVEEECNIIDIQLKDLICKTYHTYFHKGEWVLKETFWFEMNAPSNQNLKPQLEEDIEAVFWADTQKLAEVKSNTYPSILDVLTIQTNFNAITG